MAAVREPLLPTQRAAGGRAPPSHDPSAYSDTAGAYSDTAGAYSDTGGSSRSDMQPSGAPLGPARRWRTVTAPTALCLVLAATTSLYLWNRAEVFNGKSGKSGKSGDPGDSGRTSQEWIEEALGMVSNESIAQNLLLLTPVPHLAGTAANINTAKFVEGRLRVRGGVG